MSSKCLDFGFKSTKKNLSLYLISNNFNLINNFAGMGDYSAPHIIAVVLVRICNPALVRICNPALVRICNPHA